MDFAWASLILTIVQDGARLLLSKTTEPFSLALWGAVLLLLAPAVKATLTPRRRFSGAETQARLQYASEHRSLTQSRA
jgi:hypothetical protein